MVNLPMKVTGLHTNSLDRQVTERVNIENFKDEILMNRRNEMGGVRLERMQYRRWESVSNIYLFIYLSIKRKSRS